jgi:hypothetical protein
MNPTQMEELQKMFVACGRSDIISVMVTRSMAIK